MAEEAHTYDHSYLSLFKIFLHFFKHIYLIHTTIPLILNVCQLNYQ